MVNSFNAYQGKYENPFHKSEIRKIMEQKIIVIKEMMRKMYQVHLLHFFNEKQVQFLFFNIIFT